MHKEHCLICTLHQMVLMCDKIQEQAYLVDGYTADT
jgi:hypothetical protein